MQQIRTPGVFHINDRDTADLGVAVIRLDGFLGTLDGQPDLAAVGGSVGQALTSLDLNIGDRPLTARVLLQAASLTEYEQRLEKLVYLCKTGTLELRSAHMPNYVFLARWKRHTLPIFSPQFAQVAGQVAGEGELVFTSIVPYAVERVGQAYALTTMGSAGRVRIPSGSGPCLWEVEIVSDADASTSPVLSIYNDMGTLVGRVTFNVTLAANDWLRGNAHRQRITSTVASVESLNNALLAAGSRWFLIAPQFGDWESGSWSYAELMSSTGTFRAWLKVRRTKLS